MSPRSPSPAARSPLPGPPHWWEHGWSRFSLAAFPGPAVSDSRRTYLPVGRGLPPGEENCTGGFCLGLQVDLPPSFLCGIPPVGYLLSLTLPCPPTSHRAGQSDAAAPFPQPQRDPQEWSVTLGQPAQSGGVGPGPHSPGMKELTGEGEGSQQEKKTGQGLRAPGRRW